LTRSRIWGKARLSVLYCLHSCASRINSSCPKKYNRELYIRPSRSVTRKYPTRGVDDELVIAEEFTQQVDHFPPYVNFDLFSISHNNTSFIFPSTAPPGAKTFETSLQFRERGGKICILTGVNPPHTTGERKNPLGPIQITEGPSSVIPLPSRLSEPASDLDWAHHIHVSCWHLSTNSMIELSRKSDPP